MEFREVIALVIGCSLVSGFMAWYFTSMYMTNKFIDDLEDLRTIAYNYGLDKELKETIIKIDKVETFNNKRGK